VFIFRFLASGNSQITVSFSYRIAPSTVHSIIISTCEAIWNKLFPTELPQPTEEEWKKKGEEFYSLWQFPNCIGANDEKHIEIQAPHNSGSLFFNYKKTFPVVLLALVDASYKFTVIDVGGYGKSSEGGLSTRSILRKSLEANTINIPNSKPPPNAIMMHGHTYIRAMRLREKYRQYFENVGSDLHSSTKINKAVTLSE